MVVYRRNECRSDDKTPLAIRNASDGDHMAPRFCLVRCLCWPIKVRFHDHGPAGLRDVCKAYNLPDLVLHQDGGRRTAAQDQDFSQTRRRRTVSVLQSVRFQIAGSGKG